MSTGIQKTRDRYDALPYGSYSYPQSAPEQLAAVAALFGLPAPDPATARVLELGAASGGNLIPVAVRNPGATTVGIELSGLQVGMANDRAAALGLGNFEMREADLAELDPASLGQFDYIVCHGVYSWVPADVQQAVLRLCGQCLAPDGVAYVSYNTYPGWKTKEVIREAMLMHGGDREPAEQVAYGRSMLEFLAKVARKGGVTEMALSENLAQVRASPVDYVAHDYLEPFNLPCYFHAFVSAAGRNGLAYLGEALPSMMKPENYGEDLAQHLYAALGRDQVRVEQYLDFVIDRAFRQTLLVRQQRADAMDRVPDLSVLRNLHYAVQLSCADEAIRLDGSRQRFVAPTGAGIATGIGATKQALARLAQAWPGTVPFEELAGHAHAAQGTQAPLSRDEVDATIGDLLATLVFRGLARVRTAPVKLVPLGERPKVDPAMAAMLETRPPGPPHVTNRWHDTIEIGALERFLVPELDGSRSVDALEALAVEAVRDGKLDPASTGNVKQALKHLADSGAFVDVSGG